MHSCRIYLIFLMSHADLHYQQELKNVVPMSIIYLPFIIRYINICYWKFTPTELLRRETDSREKHQVWNDERKKLSQIVSDLNIGVVFVLATHVFTFTWENVRRENDSHRDSFKSETIWDDFFRSSFQFRIFRLLTLTKSY